MVRVIVKAIEEAGGNLTPEERQYLMVQWKDTEASLMLPEKKESAADQAEQPGAAAAPPGKHQHAQS